MKVVGSIYNKDNIAPYFQRGENIGSSPIKEAVPNGAINYLSQENGARVIQQSSFVKGCQPNNLLNQNEKSLWMSEMGLPQSVVFDISKLKDKPRFYQCFGLNCWHAYSSNPSLIELYVSKDGIQFQHWSTLNLQFKQGKQLFSINPIGPFYKYIEVVVKETYGANRTYINQLFLFEKNPKQPYTTQQVEDNPMKKMQTPLKQTYKSYTNKEGSKSKTAMLQMSKGSPFVSQNNNAHYVSQIDSGETPSPLINGFSSSKPNHDEKFGDNQNHHQLSSTQDYYSSQSLNIPENNDIVNNGSGQKNGKATPGFANHQLGQRIGENSQQYLTIINTLQNNFNSLCNNFKEMQSQFIEIQYEFQTQQIHQEAGGILQNHQVIDQPIDQDRRGGGANKLRKLAHYDSSLAKNVLNHHNDTHRSAAAYEGDQQYQQKQDHHQYPMSQRGNLKQEIMKECMAFCQSKIDYFASARNQGNPKKNLKQSFMNGRDFQGEKVLSPQAQNAHMMKLSHNSVNKQGSSQRKHEQLVQKRREHDFPHNSNQNKKEQERILDSEQDSEESEEEGEEQQEEKIEDQLETRLKAIVGNWQDQFYQEYVEPKLNSQYKLIEKKIERSIAKQSERGSERNIYKYNKNETNPGSKHQGQNERETNNEGSYNFRQNDKNQHRMIQGNKIQNNAQQYRQLQDQKQQEQYQHYTNESSVKVRSSQSSDSSSSSGISQERDTQVYSNNKQKTNNYNINQHTKYQNQNGKNQQYKHQAQNKNSYTDNPYEDINNNEYQMYPNQSVKYQNNLQNQEISYEGSAEKMLQQLSQIPSKEILSSPSRSQFQIENSMTNTNTLYQNNNKSEQFGKTQPFNPNGEQSEDKDWEIQDIAQLLKEKLALKAEKLMRLQKEQISEESGQLDSNRDYGQNDENDYDGGVLNHDQNNGDKLGQYLQMNTSQ